MDLEQLRKHPAYKALTADEQAAIDGRLGHWQLDAAAVAALTGDLEDLEAEDLRFWLASTAKRPWSMISLCRQPAVAEDLFEAMIEAAPELAGRSDRPELIELARALCRALVAADGARLDEGFVREELLGALAVRLDEIERRVPRWTDETILEILRDEDLDELAEALIEYTREHRGIRGLLHRFGERAQTHLFDLVHGGLFVASGAPEHEGHYERGVWSNWTGSYKAKPKRFLVPRSLHELCEAVAKAEEVRVVGGGHSFNDSPLSHHTMISLDGLDQIIELDTSKGIARVQGGIRLRDLNRALHRAGLGLPVLGSTDAQSIAGLCSTDLHGTGRDHGFLSEQLLGLTIVDAHGQFRRVRPGDELFHAAIGAIGCCGVVAELELQLVEAYNLEKQTSMVDRAEAEANIEDILAANQHVSFYYVGGAREGEAVRMHRWNHTSEPPSPEWEKQAHRVEVSDFAVSAYMPKLASSLADIDEDSWLSDVLAPDRRLIIPGSRGFGRRLFYRHDEIEFGLPFAEYQACLAKILAVLKAEKSFSIVEIRFSPDLSQALIGPGVGRRTAYIGLASPLSQDLERVFAKTEDIFRAHGGQPHLGKKTTVSAADMLDIYGDRFVRFQAVREAQDPEGKFLNAFCQRVFVG